MSSLAGRSLWYVLAPIVGAAISIMILPLATRVIGANEYGSLAFAMAISGIASTLASASLGYIFPEYYLKVTVQERAEITTSGLLLVLITASSLSIVMWLLVKLILPQVMRVDAILFQGIGLCLIGAVIGSVWAVCSEIFMLDGRARDFTIGSIGQSSVNSLVVLYFLFLYPTPDLALFYGYISGQFFLAVFGFLRLYNNIKWPVDLRWVNIMLSKVVAVGRASLAEALRNLFERSYLNAWTSVAAVGLFSHAQLYRTWAMQALNAVSRAIWPVNLTEGQASAPEFPVTRASWSLVQAGIGGVTMVFAVFGQEIIGLLTSGKFVDAAPYAVLLLCSLLLQTAGKLNMIILIVRGKGEFVSNANTAGILISILLMLALIPFWGGLGAALAAVFQMFVTRAYIVFASKKICALPFNDGWVIFGLAGSLALYIWANLAEPSVISRLVILSIVACVVLFILLPNIRVFLGWRNDRD